jgi:hypothetical protein
MERLDIDFLFYLKMMHTTTPQITIAINITIVKNEYLSAVLSIKNKYAYRLLQGQISSVAKTWQFSTN